MKQRLLALDVLRGLTIGGMILVNSPGTWRHVYAPLLHSPWNGLTLADLIFPQFIVMMGISMYISLRKFSFALHRPLCIKIIRRTFLIFIIGTGIYATATFLGALRAASLADGLTSTSWQAAFSSLAHVRILGVLQRLALCYGIGSILVTTVRHTYLPYIISGLLLGYAVILALGDGFAYGPENILARVDQCLLGLSHMYNDNGMDPEGVLSTIPSIAQVLIGFCLGKICMEESDIKFRLNRLFLYGSLLLILGFLLQDLCPINKKVWSPTFVMVTCGFSSLVLSILIWYIDVTRQFRNTRFLEIFGVNPLFCYVLSELLYILADSLPLKEHHTRAMVYTRLSEWFGDQAFTSALYAFLFVGVVWLVGSFLYKKRIYIRI